MRAADQRGRGIALGFVLAGLFLTCRSPAVALDLALDVSQYAHTSWKVRDGFVKGAISAIEQTPDGYLWLGTEYGLYRFDGVRAVLWQPPGGQQLPSNFIGALLLARDSTLWIGTLKGLASWKDGQLTNYPEVAGQFALRLFQDREQSIWIGTAGPARLCNAKAGKVQCYGNGSFGNGVDDIYEDRKGNLWVSAETGVWRWKPGPPENYRLPRAAGRVHGFAEDDAGTLLVVTSDGLKQLASGKIQNYALPGVSLASGSNGVLRSSDGSLWISNRGGLLHVHHGKTDAFGPGDGLSGTVSSIFEDREGSIWVATLAGLDRFREYAVQRISTSQGLSTNSPYSIQATTDGAIWIATSNGLNRWENGRVSVYAKRSAAGRNGARGEHQISNSGEVTEIANGGLAGALSALGLDDHGRLYVSDRDGISYFDDKHFVRVPNAPGGNIWSIAGDGHGKVWLSHGDVGLFHLTPGDAFQPIPWARFGQKGQGARALLPDPWHGGVWLGFYEGGVVYVKDDEAVRSYGAADGLGNGRVNQLHFGSRMPRALWAATEGGLSRIKDDHIETLNSKNGLPCDEVHWSVEDEDHAMWVYMPCGLARIERSEWYAWIDDPRHVIKTTLFDSSDGVPSVAVYGSSGPRVTKSPDGKIWFVQREGVSVIDPRHLPFNGVPPPVHIEQITADHKAYDTASLLRLPPLIRDLEVDYTALSLVAPEKVRFRYKLEGWDRDWQDAGNRRQAFYTNLRPGKYRFRVAACNNSGVWNAEGAFLDFAIAPAYYQTRWFQLLCVFGAILVGWALYRLRVRRLANDMSARFDERLAERTRVARELHDTLLQTIQGSKFVVDGVLMEPSKDPACMERAMEKLSDSLGVATQEARGAVNALRASTIHKNDLAAALRDAMDDCRRDTSMETSLYLSGNTRDMHPVAREEVYRIGYEAVRNACAHSQAKRLEVNLTYGRDLTLRVSDNGVGIDPVVADKGRDGHFGLNGMRERAARIGGKLTLLSSQGSGTKVILVVPGSHIFRKPGASPLEKIREVLKGLDRPSRPN